MDEVATRSNGSHRRRLHRKHRHHLPDTAKRQSISIWSILKSAIGQDLSRLTMPVQLNEPLSFLQRMAQSFESGSELLNAVAATAPDEKTRRLELIATFVVASLATSAIRIGKPFNPLLGETFELVREDLGFRFAAEQVSHHPPVSAFYYATLEDDDDEDGATPSEGSHRRRPAIVVVGSAAPKIRFNGRTVTALSVGWTRVEVAGHREVYEWRNDGEPASGAEGDGSTGCRVHNVMLGPSRMWLEFAGVMTVRVRPLALDDDGQLALNDVASEHTPSGHFERRAKLTFHESGMFSSSKDMHRFSGEVFDDDGEVVRRLAGKLTECVRSCAVQGSGCGSDADDAILNSSAKPSPHRSSKNSKSKSKEKKAAKDNGKGSSMGLKFLRKSKTINKEANRESLGAAEGGGVDAAASEGRPPLTASASIDQLPRRQSSGDGKLLWTLDAADIDTSEDSYQFSSFAASLNDPQTVSHHRKTLRSLSKRSGGGECRNVRSSLLCCTDSRFRPDMRQLERGDLPQAEVEKSRLEEEQRARRRDKATDYGTVPRWFRSCATAPSAGSSASTTTTASTGSEEGGGGASGAIARRLWHFDADQFWAPVRSLDEYRRRLGPTESSNANNDSAAPVGRSIKLFADAMAARSASESDGSGSRRGSNAR